MQKESAEKNANDEEKDPGGTFKCSRCDLEERYDYKGRRPPFSRKTAFLDDSYVMKDPFSPPERREFLLLGSDCSSCGQPVCQAAECSLFYTRRFCLGCAAKHADEFPTQVRVKLEKRQRGK